MTSSATFADAPGPANTFTWSEPSTATMPAFAMFVGPLQLMADAPKSEAERPQGMLTMSRHERSFAARDDQGPVR